MKNNIEIDLSSYHPIIVSLCNSWKWKTTDEFNDLLNDNLSEVFNLINTYKPEDLMSFSTQVLNSLPDFYNKSLILQQISAKLLLIIRNNNEIFKEIEKSSIWISDILKIVK